MSLMTTANKYENQTLANRITYWGNTEPDTQAFIFWSPAGRRVLSRGDVLDLSSRFAYRLTQYGVKPKDVVCVSLPNSPQRVVVEFGIQLAGAVSMNGQVLRADGNDLIGTLIKAKCKLIIVDPNKHNGAWQLRKKAFDRFIVKKNDAEIQSKRIPMLSTAVFCKADFFESLHSEDKFIYEGCSSQDTATIFTTSGSTGYSKLVPRTHKALLTTAAFANQSMELGSGRNCLNSSPLGWTGGFPVLYLHTGCTRVAIDESFGQVLDKSTLILDILAKETIDVALLPLPVLSSVSDIRREVNSELKLPKIFTRGQPLKTQNLNMLKELTDFVSIVYGSTELGLACEYILHMEHLDQFEDFIVGRPFNGVSVRVTDEKLQALPYMSRGEILVKSPTLSNGYIGESQESFLPDGWFRTGDIGFIREDGCLFVEGRSSDAIMHGAYILYPTWLEQLLIKCPGVKDVVIVPVPDKILHHEICTCVKREGKEEKAPSAEDIISFCQKQFLLDRSSSLSVVPKYVLFMTEFPLTSTNKLNRRELADIAKEQLHL